MSHPKRNDPFAELYGEFSDRLRGDRWQPDVDVFETEKEIIVRVERVCPRNGACVFLDERLVVVVDGPPDLVERQMQRRRGHVTGLEGSRKRVGDDARAIRGQRAAAEIGLQAVRKQVPDGGRGAAASRSSVPPGPRAARPCAATVAEPGEKDETGATGLSGKRRER